MKAKRPVNLDLRTFAYPPTAIASILHRISGVILFILFPFILYLWSLSLKSSASFAELQSMMDCIATRFALWVFGSAFIYHAIAGFRHLLSDWDILDKLPQARWTAVGTMGLSLILTLYLGIILW